MAILAISPTPLQGYLALDASDRPCASIRVVSALVFDAIMNRVSAIDRIRLTRLADAKAALEDDLAMIDEPDGDPGRVELFT
jgi:hypothetical protein